MPRVMAARAAPKRIGVVPPVTSRTTSCGVYARLSSSERRCSKRSKECEISIGESTILYRNEVLGSSSVHFVTIGPSMSWDKITPTISGSNSSTASSIVSVLETTMIRALVRDVAHASGTSVGHPSMPTPITGQ